RKFAAAPLCGHGAPPPSPSRFPPLLRSGANGRNASSGKINRQPNDLTWSLSAPRSPSRSSATAVSSVCRSQPPYGLSRVSLRAGVASARNNASNPLDITRLLSGGSPDRYFSHFACLGASSSMLPLLATHLLK